MQRNMIFKGLSGFPITPLKNGDVDVKVLRNICHHIDNAGLDSIGVLGSTGSFAYLNTQQRNLVMECWSTVRTPWIAGVSATTTQAAIDAATIAYQNGAQGIIANAFAYVPLSAVELKRYFLELAEASPLPLCVYDNPVTTGQGLSHALICELAEHENIAAVKMFAQPNNQQQHQALQTRDIAPGYAVDANCCEAMIGGASAWYSTLAGTLPEYLVPVMKAIKEGDREYARQLNKKLAPLYALMKQHSGYRLVHALANQRGWDCELPSPLVMPEFKALAGFLPK